METWIDGFRSVPTNTLVWLLDSLNASWSVEPAESTPPLESIKSAELI